MTIAVALSEKLRRQVVRKALRDDATLQGLTTAPHVVTPDTVRRKANPLKIVTLAVTTAGEGPLGWHGGIAERMAIDIFVDGDAVDDPFGHADDIRAAVEGALAATSLNAALAGLSITDVEAIAQRVTEWGDVAEPGPEQTAHLTADYDVQFVRLQ